MAAHSTVICILTYCRPRSLRSTLNAIARLEDSGDDVRVIVIDNDEARSAEPVVDAARASMTLPVDYVMESQRGISYARNRGVVEARRVGADRLAFVDDDGQPDPGWLRELVGVLDRSGADGVLGPILPTFEQPPPPWVLRGRFFERPRWATGTVLPWGTTGNVLLDMSVFGDEPTPFPEWLALAGGEDTHFFRRKLLAGRRFVWCDEARLRETVPASRVTARWLLRRQYRRGNTLSLCLRDLEDSPRRRIRRAVAASGRVLAGLGRAVIGVGRGRAGVVAGLQQTAFGAGQLVGLSGRVYSEYTAIHGS